MLMVQVDSLITGQVAGQCMGLLHVDRKSKTVLFLFSLTEWEPVLFSAFYEYICTKKKSYKVRAFLVMLSTLSVLTIAKC